MPKKTLLVIAAVAVMLVGATSAYGYHETWDGWFNSGWLECLGARFEYTGGEGRLFDHTYGSVDSFFVYAVTPSTFTCESGEYAGYYIRLWPGATGWKDTGQSGHKEAYNGGWTGKARLYRPYQDPEDFDVWGTWDTGTEYDGMYFDYDPDTPTYSAHWYYGSSTPAGIITGGKGGSAGELQE